MPITNRMADLRVSFTLTKREFLTAWTRLQLRRRAALWFASVGGALVVVGILIGSGPVIAAGFAYSAYWFLCCVWWLPRRLWRRHRRFREPQAFTFTDTDVTTELAEVRSTADWSYWIGLERVGAAYVLRSKAGYMFIPVRALGGDTAEQRFREFVGSRVGGNH